MTTPDDKSMPQPMHERIERTWRSHPVVTLSGLVAIVTIAAGIWPVVSYLAGHYVTTDEAHDMELRLRRETVSMRVQLTVNQQMVARNRKNDCDIKREAKEQMSPLERVACSQYDEDYRAATSRLEEAQKAAATTYREK